VVGLPPSYRPDARIQRDVSSFSLIQVPRAL
jgi:hypothetical protein